MGGGGNCQLRVCNPAPKHSYDHEALAEAYFISILSAPTPLHGNTLFLIQCSVTHPSMSNSSTPAQAQSRFKAPNNMSTQERISTNTVGLVNLSDFRKRRAEVLEQQEREAREALRSGTTTPLIDRSQSATPNNLSDGGSERPVKKQKKPKKALVSFGDDEEDDDDAGPALKSKGKANKATDLKSKGGDQSEPSTDGDLSTKDSKKPGGKIAANTSVGFVPRAMTKSALRREAAERDALRKEFLALQEAVKATEIAMPFVFYDGTNIPGGTVRVKKGEFVWVFLDKSRKVGAELGVGGEKNANVRREWARVGVDDLMLVRGTMIIPHVSLPSISRDNDKINFCID